MRGIGRSGCVCKRLIFVPFILLLVIIFYQPALSADVRLIDPEELSRTLSKWVVIDARPEADWTAGHIPGARSFSWENYTRTDEKGVEFRVFPPQELASALAALGMDEKSPVAIYGDADKSWGGEGWDVWVLSWLGHKGPIRVLDGGIQAWLNQNLPLTKGKERAWAGKARYQINVNPQLDISTEEIVRQRSSLVLIDVRSTLEWLKGRIPGAVHIPWEKFYEGKERRPLSSSQVKKLLASNGVDPTRSVVYYCLGGIRSAYAWMVHYLAGLPPARNYEGGMAAWQKRSKTAD
jgi:thiosulfate/3-mercaptopyruvate sulfurtransferase